MWYTYCIERTDDMKRILCYGDSNTYGHDPKDCSRLDGRWTKQLAKILGSDYEIIEEGLCGRTTVFDDHFEYGLNGKAMLEPVIKTHRPLDLIILMLGTNDMQLQHGMTAMRISHGVESLIKLMKNPMLYNGDKVPQILVVSPPLIDISIENSFFSEIYGGKRAVDISKSLAPHIEAVAKLHNTHFIDAAKYAKPSPLDGIHMDSDNHKKLAEAFADKIKEIGI